MTTRNGSSVCVCVVVAVYDDYTHTRCDTHVNTLLLTRQRALVNETPSLLPWLLVRCQEVCSRAPAAVCVAAAA